MLSGRKAPLGGPDERDVIAERAARRCAHTQPDRGRSADSLPSVRTLPPLAWATNRALRARIFVRTLPKRPGHEVVGGNELLGDIKRAPADSRSPSGVSSATAPARTPCRSRRLARSRRAPRGRRGRDGPRGGRGSSIARLLAAAPFSVSICSTKSGLPSAASGSATRAVCPAYEGGRGHVILSTILSTGCVSLQPGRS